MPEDKYKKEDKPQKGVAGEDTGGRARKAVKKAKDRNATNETIGKATNRSASTIAQIHTGTIKNPPADLAGKVSKAKSIKKEKREDMFGQMSFQDSLKLAVDHGKKVKNSN